MEYKKPIIKCVSHTKNPIATLFAVEQTSKTDSHNPYFIDSESIQKVLSLSRMRNSNPSKSVLQGVYNLENSKEFKDTGCTDIGEYKDMVYDKVKQIITMAIPVAEFISFQFRFENVTIAFREQLVRHRTNSYWVQSGRTGAQNYDSLIESGKVHIPESISKKGLEQDYINVFKTEESFIRLARANGVPDEDSREVLGNGVLHRLSASINLRSLIQMTQHRCCFIAQQHWQPVIFGIMEELMKIDPIFKFMGKPPCFRAGEFTGCKYEGMSEARYNNDDDEGAICPLYHAHLPKEKRKALSTLPNNKWDKDLNKKYAKLWSIRFK